MRKLYLLLNKIHTFEEEAQRNGYQEISVEGVKEDLPFERQNEDEVVPFQKLKDESGVPTNEEVSLRDA